jgi:cytochrome P450
LSVEGERWEVQRRTLAPLFARRPFASFTNAMLVAADLLTDRWRRVELDTTVDVAAELTLLTLNVLALTMFSDGIGGDLDEFRSAMNAYLGSLGRISAFDLFGSSELCAAARPTAPHANDGPFLRDHRRHHRGQAPDGRIPRQIATSPKIW